MKASYLETIDRIERLHRCLIDLVGAELTTTSEINATQALLLFNIGDAHLTAGELRSRGYYLGSNVSYNLKKLVSLGYVTETVAPADRRVHRICLTAKGRAVADLVDSLFDPDPGLNQSALANANAVLSSIERFWVADSLNHLNPTTSVRARTIPKDVVA